MKLKRFFVISTAVVAVLILSCVLCLGVVYAWAGVATIRVTDVEEGINLYLPLPMLMVEAAVSSAKWGHADHMSMEIDAHFEQLGEYAPLIKALLSELENCPDFNLVEVEDHGSFVKVRKQGGKLLVEVDDDGSQVRVSFPLRSVVRTVDKLASL
jgi:hypothetical protein